MDKKEIFKKLDKLYQMWKNGDLGGNFMPEDSNPQLDKDSLENYLYFTLPMALNYQRNSYKLWESAKKTYEDSETQFVFDMRKVIQEDEETVRLALTKYKLAMQANKQTEIWIKLCKSFVRHFDGDIRMLFIGFDGDVLKIKQFVQHEHKKDFPYLSGEKICNYWLYVLNQYSDVALNNLHYLTVAVDTHVLQASVRLGIIEEVELGQGNIQKLVTEKIEDILRGSKYHPIDMHTPLWFWSRNGFKEIE